MRRALPLLSAFMALILSSGCGYHTLGSAAHIPADVHTISVPFFENRTQFSHTEVALTQATVRELNTRTKFHVLPREDARRRGCCAEGNSSQRDHRAVHIQRHQRAIIELHDHAYGECLADGPRWPRALPARRIHLSISSTKLLRISPHLCKKIPPRCHGSPETLPSRW